MPSGNSALGASGSGVGKFLKFKLISLPIWLTIGASLLLKFASNPKKFLKQVDRQQEQYPDPFPELEHRTVEANGLRFHTVSAGRGKGKKLMMMVHGFPEHWYSWRYQLEAFKDEYEVVSFDLRGYGLTDKPQGKDAYSLEKLSSDIPALVKALGHESCVLVAHDWGGVIAWLTAHAYSSMIDQLVVIAAPHPRCDYDWDQYKRSWYILLFQAPWLPEALLTSNDCEAIDAMFRQPPTGTRRPDAVSLEEVERYKQAFQRPGTATAALNYYRAFVDEVTLKPSPNYVRICDHREKLQVPTLLIWGANDTALGPQLAKQIPGFVEDLDLHILEDCSHWAQQDRPEEVNSLINNFLQKAREALPVMQSLAN